jgi:dipeptidyl aminopeptidase/acylaminoacyl peptidase
MTSERRFETDLPEILGQLAMGPTPDYRNDIVRATARTRQRPAWTFPGRWIPMTAVASRVAAAPRIPWRILVVVALLLILAVSALLIVGSQRRVTPPFGLAANGQVAYEANGDIYTVDPVSGISTAVVAGPEIDTRPVWSRDGAHFVFERKSVEKGRLFVANANGTEIVAVMTDASDNLWNFTFSPDGTDVVFTSGPDPNIELWIGKADGSGVRRLAIGSAINSPTFRPPDGSEIVFGGESAQHRGTGLYAVDVKSGTVREILPPSPGVGRDWVRVSPDGSRIAYSAFVDDPDRNAYVVHVVDADGTDDRALPMPAGATFQDAPAWSNDGRRLIVARGYDTRDQDMALAIIPADGSGIGVETRHGLILCCDTVYEWSPDDTTILVAPNGDSQDAAQQLLVDPTTGASRPAPWKTTSLPAWQRRAP